MHSHFKTSEEFVKEISDENYEESLLYGFRNNQTLNTQLLLTIGKAHDTNEEQYELRTDTSVNLSEKFTRNAPEIESDKFLRLFYKRLAPKMEVLHQLDIHIFPISIITCDGAFDDILAFFHCQEVYAHYSLFPY